VKQDGRWRFHAQGTQLHLGAWSVRQDGEGLVIVIDGFDVPADQAIELRAIGDQ
jgi:hypothetical protein